MLLLCLGLALLLLLSVLVLLIIIIISFIIIIIIFVIIMMMFIISRDAASAGCTPTAAGPAAAWTSRAYDNTTNDRSRQGI